jgi:hypothetical protein
MVRSGFIEFVTQTHTGPEIVQAYATGRQLRLWVQLAAQCRAFATLKIAALRVDLEAACPAYRVYLQ